MQNDQKGLCFIPFVWNPGSSCLPLWPQGPAIISQPADEDRKLECEDTQLLTGWRRRSTWLPLTFHAGILVIQCSFSSSRLRIRLQYAQEETETEFGVYIASLCHGPTVFRHSSFHSYFGLLLDHRSFFFFPFKFIFPHLLNASSQPNFICENVLLSALEYLVRSVVFPSPHFIMSVAKAS